MGEYADDAIDWALNDACYDYDSDWFDEYGSDDDMIPIRRHRGPKAPAGSKLAQARMAAHRAFDPIWKDGEKTRRNAYNWLSRKMGVRPGDCHIGLFDVHACERVIAICNAYRFRRQLGLDLV